MIKKTTAVLTILLMLSGASALGAELETPEYTARRRLALNVLGIGGAVTAVGAVFFFVGRSGASLHINSDGSLKAAGLLEEAQAASRLQRVSAAIFGLGLATTIAGTILLLLGRKRVDEELAVSLSPTGFEVRF